MNHLVEIRAAISRLSALITLLEADLYHGSTDNTENAHVHLAGILDDVEAAVEADDALRQKYKEEQS